ncbi:hypothetical protein [Ktedonobacter racemifer]|uniref:hypothetical protein n=1 Tax=Ktedonobacter racemifer TaxID=363277 RepID=UPI001FCBD2DB|nr:hypothetical protein [Ktedonobacter racemifer]
MRLLTFQSPVGPRLGIQTTRGVVDVVVAREQLLAHSMEFVPDTIEEVYATGERGLAALRHLLKAVEAQEQPGTWLLAEESLQYGLCVPRTGRSFVLVLTTGVTRLNRAWRPLKARCSSLNMPIVLPPVARRYPCTRTLFSMITRRS